MQTPELWIRIWIQIWVNYDLYNCLLNVIVLIFRKIPNNKNSKTLRKFSYFRENLKPEKKKFVKFKIILSYI